VTDGARSRRRRGVAGALQRLPGDLLLSGPRAIRFARRARQGDGGTSIVPAAPAGTVFTAAALMDEVALAFMRVGRLEPSPAEIERIADEIRVAAKLFAAQGWLAEPRSFHQSPPAPVGP
jgi:hypothetical protein